MFNDDLCLDLFLIISPMSEEDHPEHVGCDDGVIVQIFPVEYNHYPPPPPPPSGQNWNEFKPIMGGILL
jgi:hypothetical protein